MSSKAGTETIHLPEARAMLDRGGDDRLAGLVPALDRRVAEGRRFSDASLLARGSDAPLAGMRDG